MRPGGAQKLIDALAGDAEQADDARDALVKLGDAALGPLVSALEHPDVYVRRDAALLLGELGDPRAVAPLLAVFARLDPARGGEGDYWTWLGATMALAALGAVEILEPLCRVLELPPIDGDLTDFWQTAAAALGDLGDRRAVPALVDVLGRHHPFVDVWAVEALEQLGGAEAEQAARRWREAEQREREAASAALTDEERRANAAAARANEQALDEVLARARPVGVRRRTD